jgi:hypothetical protein
MTTTVSAQNPLSEGDASYQQSTGVTFCEVEFCGCTMAAVLLVQMLGPKRNSLRKQTCVNIWALADLGRCSPPEFR